MKQCPYCGTMLYDNAVVCNICGFNYQYYYYQQQMYQRQMYQQQLYQQQIAQRQAAKQNQPQSRPQTYNNPQVFQQTGQKKTAQTYQQSEYTQYGRIESDTSDNFNPIELSSLMEDNGQQNTAKKKRIIIGSILLTISLIWFIADGIGGWNSATGSKTACSMTTKDYSNIVIYDGTKYMYDITYQEFINENAEAIAYVTGLSTKQAKEFALNEKCYKRLGYHYDGHINYRLLKFEIGDEYVAFYMEIQSDIETDRITEVWITKSSGYSTEDNFNVLCNSVTNSLTGKALQNYSKDCKYKTKHIDNNTVYYYKYNDSKIVSKVNNEYKTNPNCYRQFCIYPFAAEEDTEANTDNPDGGTTTSNTTAVTSKTTTSKTTTTTAMQDDRKAIGCIYESDNYSGAEFMLTLDEFTNSYNDYIDNYYMNMGKDERDFAVKLYSLDKNYWELMETTTDKDDGKQYDNYITYMNETIKTTGEYAGLGRPEIMWLTAVTDHNTGNIVKLIITLPFPKNISVETMADCIQTFLHPVTSHSMAVLAEPHNNDSNVSDKMLEVIQDAEKRKQKEKKFTYLNNGIGIYFMSGEDKEKNTDYSSFELIATSENHYKDNAQYFTLVEYN